MSITADKRPGKLRAEERSPLAFAVNQRDRHAIDLVRHALSTGKVLMAYQPVMQVARMNRPAFYEGLVRVCDQTGRVIPARDFIDAVETTEVGRQLDCHSIRLGLETLAAQPGLRLSVNMSARSIDYAPWLSALRYGLRDDPAIAERLILEITEKSAMECPDQVQAFMDELQGLGVSFALDDFGSGYTSFRHLKDFFFDILKIDGQFIHDIHNNHDNQVLTAALVSIGQHFEMATVAEYVETAADAEYLSQIGIDCMQGYYFGPPTTNPYWTAAEKTARAS